MAGRLTGLVLVVWIRAFGDEQFRDFQIAVLRSGQEAGIAVLVGLYSG